jgi:hypothetical protein
MSNSKRKPSHISGHDQRKQVAQQWLWGGKWLEMKQKWSWEQFIKTLNFMSKIRKFNPTGKEKPYLSFSKGINMIWLVSWIDDNSRRWRRCEGEGLGKRNQKAGTIAQARGQISWEFLGFTLYHYHMHPQNLKYRIIQ